MFRLLKFVIPRSRKILRRSEKLKSEKYYAAERTPNLKENIIQTKKEMRKRAENEIVKRVDAIRKYLTDPDRENYISHDQIFNKYIMK